MLEHSVFMLIVLFLYYLFCSKLFWKKKNKKKKKKKTSSLEAEGLPISPAWTRPSSVSPTAFSFPPAHSHGPIGPGRHALSPPPLLGSLTAGTHTSSTTHPLPSAVTGKDSVGEQPGPSRTFQILKNPVFLALSRPLRLPSTAANSPLHLNLETKP